MRKRNIFKLLTLIFVLLLFYGCAPKNTQPPSQGVLIWQEVFRESDNDCAYSIQQTSDGGYIVAGYTSSFGAGGNDVYIIKLDKFGEREWQEVFGESDNDYAYSIQQTTDGGYIVAGYTESFGAGGDVYIIKLSSNGQQQWYKTFGGSGNDCARSIQQTTDGGYIVAGETVSIDPSGVYVYSYIYLIKLDANGNTGPYPTQ